MKTLLLTSLLGVVAGASSLTYQVVQMLGGHNGRYEMTVLANGEGVVTLDRETGTVRYVYGRDVIPPVQWAVEFKPGSSIGQVMPHDWRPHE